MTAGGIFSSRAGIGSRRVAGPIAGGTGSVGRGRRRESFCRSLHDNLSWRRRDIGGRFLGGAGSATSANKNNASQTERANCKSLNAFHFYTSPCELTANLAGRMRAVLSYCDGAHV
jgi:hypothetical protein